MLKRFFLYFVISLIPAILLLSYTVFLVSNIIYEKWDTDKDYWINKNFNELSFYDSQGNNQKIIHNKNGFTVIDFWFAGCAPCIKEMEFFDEFLKFNRDKFQIYSISIDQFSFWNHLIGVDSINKNSQLDFLSRSNPAWIHLSIHKNDSSSTTEAIKQLHINTYPTYIILDNKGKVIGVTHNLFQFVSTELGGKSKFLLFLNEFLESGSNNIIKVVRAFCIGYVLLYTIIFFLVLSIMRIKKYMIGRMSTK